MENLPKPFIQLGNHFINMNAIAFVIQLPNGNLRITTTAIKRGGVAHSFIVRSGTFADEFRRQIYPFIAMHASSVIADEE